MSNASDWRVIDGCPVRSDVAPYIKILLDDVERLANSIYRGTDPVGVRLLHRHGKHSQAELYATLPRGVANPPGRSTHEKKSDGVAYPNVDPGNDLQWWQQGVDSGADTQADRNAIERAARARGWEVFHAYDSGVELHHWNFKKKPRPQGPRTMAKIIRIRRRLPHS